MIDVESYDALEGTWANGRIQQTWYDGLCQGS